MGDNPVPKFIFRLSRFPVYRGSVLGRFYCTSFEFEEADKTMTELRNEAVRVRSRHRYEAAIKAGVSGVYSEHLKWIALAQYTIN